MKIPYIVKYSIQRILLLLLTTFIILSLTFFLVKMLPGEQMPTSEAALFSYCQDQVEKGNYLQYFMEMPSLGEAKAIYTDPNGRMYYYYARPLIDQYGVWLKGIFTRWDWGTSSAFQAGSSAIYIIASRMGPTIKINIWALIISVPLGFVLGIWAALKKNTATDGIISTVVMVMISVPSFVVISLLMLWFAFGLHWFPTSWPSANASLSSRILGYFIPVMSLCFGTIASFTRYTRAELCEVMSSDFLLLARTKGLSKRQCVVRHAMRNSLVPIVPMIIGQFIGILSGSMVLEQLYGIPGIGQLFVRCISLKDYNVLLVDMALYTLIGLFANLLVDLSYGIIDPRIRMGEKAA